MMRSRQHSVFHYLIGIFLPLAGLTCGALSQVVSGPILELDEAIHEDYLGGSSNAQNVLPFAAQRGVGLDGSLRSQAPFGWQVNANPYAHEWNNNARYNGDIMLHTGRYSPTEVDLSLPAPGFSWTVGRTYSIPETGGTFEGYMGYNWQQFSQPEIVYHAVAGSGAGQEDVIYLVYGADRFLEFRELEDGSDVFRGVNGAAGAIVRDSIAGTSVDHDVYVYWDRSGTRSYFFDEDDGDNSPTGYDAGGQLWKIIDAAGNTAYVGHETNPTTAITSGYDSGARMQVAYDTAGREYQYNYETKNGKIVLTSVEVLVDHGSGYVSTGAKVEYEYATSTPFGVNTYGIGDLYEIVVTMPLSSYNPNTDSPVVSYTTNYRYFHTVSGSPPDTEHWIRAKHNAESMRRFHALFPTSGSIYDYTSIYYLQPYSEAFVDSYYVGADPNAGKLKKVAFPGQTGGPNAGSRGNLDLDYIDYLTFSNSANAYDSEHATYTQAEADSLVFNQYFDEAGQPLSRVVNPSAFGSIPASWTFVSRDADVASSGDDDEPIISGAVAGMINVLARPMSISSGDVNPSNLGTGYRTPCTLKANTSGKTDGNLVYIFPRETTTSDPYHGFMLSRSWQNGGTPVATANADGPHKIHAYEYLDDVNTVELAGEYEMFAPFMSQMTRYTDLDFGSGQGSGEVTTYSYVFHAEPLSGTSTAAVDDPQWLVPREITTGMPAVPTSMLGSGVSETETEFYRADGTMVYFRDANDVYSYTEHENNLSIRKIKDADLSQTSDYATADAPSNYWATVPTTTGAMQLITDRVRDEIGRVDEVTLPTGRVQSFYHTALEYGELVTVGSAKTSGSTHKGPGSFVAYDHVGNMIADATIAVEPDSEGTPGQTTTALSGWVDTEALDLLDALESDFEFSRIETTIFDESGTVPFTIRSYHTLPTSGPGDRFYNYDEEIFSYGTEYRTEFHIQPNGVVHSYSFDQYNEIKSIQVGSYDPKWEPDYTGSLTLGSLPSSNPGQNAYDTEPFGGGVKLSECCVPLVSLYGNIFAKLCYENMGPALTLGTGEQGISFFQSDIQERVVFDYNPDAPHTFRQYDNLGRLVAVGTYKAVPTSDLGLLVSPLPDPQDRDAPDIFTDFDSRDEGPTNIPSERIGLVEYVYNPRGQLYKVITHEINQSAGSSLDTIETIMGYDAVGRRVYANNGSVTKTTYDAIGRLTDVYTVADNDDVLTNYSDLLDVEDDVVVRETHYAINNESSDVVLRVDVDRKPAVPLQPQVLGQLDSTDYSDHTSINITGANMKGRPQITEYQYDDLDRPLERHAHGTGNIDTATFSLSSPPSGALVTELEYEPGGRVASVTDPLGRVSKRSYDLSDQLTQVIDNFVDSGTAADENRKTEYEYENTQLRYYHAYKDATNKQTTRYDWAVYDSGVVYTYETHDRIREIEYPDGESETFVWDLYGNLEYFTDRAGNEFEITYDLNYRPEMIDYKVVASGFTSSTSEDIEIAYEDRGFISSIGQYQGSTTFDIVSYEYDGWGALKSYSQSHDWLKSSAAAAVDKAVSYEWDASHTSGPSTLRLTTQTNPDSSVLAMSYIGATNSALSRVLSMTLDVDGSGTTHSPVTVASYKYLGLDRVSRTEYPENDVYSTLQNASHAYDALDRFNRVTRSRWNRERASNEVPFFDTTVHWDDNSNVVGTTDHIFDTQYNFIYANDDLDRLEQAKRGGGTGTGITSLKEQEDWVLSKIGNWDNHDLDLNGDLDWSDTSLGEFQAQSTFSDLNEQTLIELDEDNDSLYDDGSITRGYDDAGNLTSDPDKGHVYKWDSLGRLTKIFASNGTDQIAEFKYNALGYRIAEQFDSTGDGFITGADDVWTRLVYDARWRVIEKYKVDISANSEDQTERHVHHAAGLNGIGTGSYIDSVVLRDRDSDGNGSLEERHYFCQNWRQDVVAVVDDQGYQLEQARYTPYGEPFAIPFVDQDQDGDVDTDDGDLLLARYNGSYDVRADADLDGDVDFGDVSFYSAQGSAINTTNIGRGVQSSYGHNRGYAGYWRIDQLGLSHVRYRWYDADTGTWLSKDPAGYPDSSSLFQYIGASPMTFIDPSGLAGIKINGGEHEGTWFTPETGRSDSEGQGGHPVQGKDRGPHMHGPGGKKFFPQTGEIYDPSKPANNRISPAPNSFKRKIGRGIDELGNKCKGGFDPQARRALRRGNLAAIGVAIAALTGSTNAASDELGDSLNRFFKKVNNGDNEGAALEAADIGRQISDMTGSNIGGNTAWSIMHNIIYNINPEIAN